MHNAPAVSFPVGRSRFQAWFLSGVWVAGAAVCTYWASAMDVVGWRHALALAMPVAAGTAAWWVWQHRVSGRLHWDGQSWLMETTSLRQTTAASASAPRAGTGTGIEMSVSDLCLHLDLQGFLLLRLRLLDGSVRWLWLDQGPDLVQWQALRRAVYANAGATPGVSSPALDPSLDSAADAATALIPASEPLQKAKA